MKYIVASGVGSPIQGIPDDLKADGFCYQRSLWLLTGVKSALLAEWPNFMQIEPELKALPFVTLYKFYSNLLAPVPCTVADSIRLGYGAITNDALSSRRHGSWLVQLFDIEEYNDSKGKRGGHWVAIRDGFTTEFNEWYPLDNWIIDFGQRAALRRIYEVKSPAACD